MHKHWWDKYNHNELKIKSVVPALPRQSISLCWEKLRTANQVSTASVLRYAVWVTHSLQKPALETLAIMVKFMCPSSTTSVLVWIFSTIATIHKSRLIQSNRNKGDNRKLVGRCHKVKCSYKRQPTSLKLALKDITTTGLSGQQHRLST